MRNGYGPTGISFNYTTSDLARDAKAGPLEVEMVFNGNTAMTMMDMTTATPSEIAALHKSLDCVCLGQGKTGRIFTLFTA